MLKNWMKMRLVRQRVRTKSQFQSLWGFDGRLSSLGKTAILQFAEFSSCMVSVPRGIVRVVLVLRQRLVFAVQVARQSSATAGK